MRMWKPSPSPIPGPFVRVESFVCTLLRPRLRRGGEEAVGVTGINGCRDGAQAEENSQQGSVKLIDGSEQLVRNPRRDLSRVGGERLYRIV